MFVPRSLGRCALVLFLAAVPVGRAQQPALPIVPDSTMQPVAAGHAHAVLLFFVASDCPVSNRYFPEMERLAARFAAQGVQTRYVYPNAYETAAGVGQHQVAFGAPMGEARRDVDGTLVQATGARTTPEAVLLLHEGPQWRVAYRGRIDDRYVHIGLERPQAEHHDLERAVTAALARQPVLPPGGPAVGCAIVPAATMGSTR